MFKNNPAEYHGSQGKLCPSTLLKTNEEAKEFILTLTSNFQSIPWREATYHVLVGGHSRPYKELVTHLASSLRVHLRPIKDAYELVVEELDLSKGTDSLNASVSPQESNYTGLVIYSKDEPITSTKSHFRFKSESQVKLLTEELDKLKLTMSNPVSLLKREGSIKKAFDPFEL